VLGKETEPEATAFASVETLRPRPRLGEPDTLGGFRCVKVCKGATSVSLARREVAVLRDTGAGLLNCPLRSPPSPRSRAGKPEGDVSGSVPEPRLGGMVTTQQKRGLEEFPNEFYSRMLNLISKRDQNLPSRWAPDD
jgi:hypothetical protein